MFYVHTHTHTHNMVPCVGAGAWFTLTLDLWGPRRWICLLADTERNSFNPKTREQADREKILWYLGINEINHLGAARSHTFQTIGSFAVVTIAHNNIYFYKSKRSMEKPTEILSDAPPSPHCIDKHFPLGEL
jgi:hypothetical protein